MSEGSAGTQGTEARASLDGASFTKDERVVFVSDVHLRYEDQPYLDQFTSFLDQIRADGAAAVYIHGDLFDFYVGPRQGARPFYQPLFDALRRLIDAGIPVAVLHGNRDYLMGKRFTEAGCELIPDETTLDLAGTKTHLSHGDQFCIHDRSYQFWARGVLRMAPFRFLVKVMPVSIGFWLARRYRKVSAKKFRKHAGEGNSRLPTVFDGVKQMLERSPHDAVICGHIHDLAETPVEAGETRATLYTTGAWEQAPNCVVWSGGELRARENPPAGE